MKKTMLFLSLFLATTALTGCGASSLEIENFRKANAITGYNDTNYTLRKEQITASTIGADFIEDDYSYSSYSILSGRSVRDTLKQVTLGPFKAYKNNYGDYYDLFGSQIMGPDLYDGFSYQSKYYSVAAENSSIYRTYSNISSNETTLHLLTIYKFSGKYSYQGNFYIYHKFH